MNQEEVNFKTNEFPKPNSPLYNLLQDDHAKMEKTLKKWKVVNKWLIIPLYKVFILPLLGFGKIFLLLQTKGRITGKKRTTPLEYHKIDGVITVISSRGEEGGWMKNIRKNPEEVYLRIGFKKYKPKIEILSDEDSVIQFFQWYVSKHPRAAKYLFGWDPKSDVFNRANFVKVSKKTCIIKFHP